MTAQAELIQAPANESMAMTTDVANMVTGTGLGEVDGQNLWKQFAYQFNELNKLGILALEIGENDSVAARSLRLKAKNCRVAVKHKKDDLKAAGIRRGRAIDGFNNIMIHDAKLIEDRMEAIENAEAIRAAAELEVLENKKAELAAERDVELSKYIDTEFYPLGEMPESAYNDLLANSKFAHDKRIEDAAKKEADRIEAEKEAERIRIAEEEAIAVEDERVRKLHILRVAESDKYTEPGFGYSNLGKMGDEGYAVFLRKIKASAEEREKQRLENIRLAEVAADEKAKRIASEKVAEAEKVKREADEAKAQAERDRVAAIEKEKREAAERVAADEKKRREDIEAAEAQRIADEEAIAKKAAAAPDKAKLILYSEALANIKRPEMSSREGFQAAVEIDNQVGQLLRYINGVANSI